MKYDMLKIYVSPFFFFYVFKIYTQTRVYFSNARDYRLMEMSK